MYDGPSGASDLPVDLSINLSAHQSIGSKNMVFCFICGSGQIVAENWNVTYRMILGFELILT
jgi:hypothetical protein